MTNFIQDKRVIGCDIEGHGEYQTRWNRYEVKCPCGKWTRNYGDVSEQVGDNPNDQAWLCEKCAAEAVADWESN
jgi:hypothetical protein